MRTVVEVVESEIQSPLLETVLMAFARHPDTERFLRFGGTLVTGLTDPGGSSIGLRMNIERNGTPYDYTYRLKEWAMEHREPDRYAHWVICEMYRMLLGGMGIKSWSEFDAPHGKLP